MKNIGRRIVLVIRGIRMFKDWHVWLLSRFGLSLRSGLGDFRFRDGTVFRLDYSHNNIGSFQEVWLMDQYEKYRKVRPGDVVVDIGASIGTFAVLAAKRGARVFAYEPTPRSFLLLKQNTSGLNVIAFEQAVTDVEGEVDLFETSNDEGNSLLHPESPTSPTHIIRVPATTLSEIVRHIGNVDFLKMDCEGGELSILRGAEQKVFDRIDTIAMECHGNLAEVRSILEGRGYDVISIVHERGYGYAYASRK